MAEINRIHTRNCRNPVASIHEVKFRSCREITIREDLDFITAQVKYCKKYVAAKAIDSLASGGRFAAINIAIVHKLNQFNALDKNSREYNDSVEIIKYAMSKFLENPDKPTMTGETITKLKSIPELTELLMGLSIMEDPSV